MNSELAEIIPQLCTYQQNNQPPLTIEQFKAFEAELECSLLDDIKQLYLEHDGHEPQGNHSMVLMSSVQVLELYVHIKKREPWWYFAPNFVEYIRYLWYDEDGNYAGLYVSGPLIGKITFFNHEIPEPAPVFRSIITFYRSNLELTRSKQWDWSKMLTDYPVIGEINSKDEADDLTVALICLDEWHKSQTYDELNAWSSCIIALMPPAETERLLFGLAYNSFDKSKIMDIVAKRRYKPAITRITNNLIHTLYSTYELGFKTLGEIGDAEAGKSILKLMQSSKDIIHSAATALQKCGYQVRKTENDYEYLAPNETTWRKL